MKRFILMLAVCVSYVRVSEGSIPSATKTKYEAYLKRFDNKRGQIPYSPDLDQNRANVTLFLKSKFEAAGLTVYLQNFSSTETNTRKEVNGTNLIAVLPGTAYRTAQDQVVILAAHIDTYGTMAGGANNDGTGLVGLLAIAEDLTGPEKCTLNNTIVFAAFDRSETVDIGLGRTYCNKSCGSIEFLKNKATYIGSGKIKLAMVMDCIGNYDKSIRAQSFTQPLMKYFKEDYELNAFSDHPGDFLAISGRKDDAVYLEDFKKFYEANNVGKGYFLTKFQWGITGVPNAQNRSNLVNAFKDGDHMSFWDANFHAILLTDTCYNRGFMQSCKTRDCDKSGNLPSRGYDFMYSTIYTAMKITKKLTCSGPCASCDPNADCKNNVCVCKTGFTGNGASCTDIDECASKPCHPNAQCTNMAGSFRCDCKKEYTGNGFNCTDIDGCVSKTCHPNAQCSNTAGSFRCDCKKECTGNGYNCIAITTGSSMVSPHQLLISISAVLSSILILAHTFSYTFW